MQKIVPDNLILIIWNIGEHFNTGNEIESRLVRAQPRLLRAK